MPVYIDSDITEFKKHLFMKSIGFKTTHSLESDIKSIRKFNTYISKFKKTSNDKYRLSIFNLFVRLSKQFTLDEYILTDIKQLFIATDNRQLFDIIYREFLTAYT